MFRSLTSRWRTRRYDEQYERSRRARLVRGDRQLAEQLGALRVLTFEDTDRTTGSLQQVRAS